jgi:hypothetical protein
MPAPSSEGSVRFHNLPHSSRIQVCFLPLVGSALDELPLSKFGKFACIPAQLLKGTRLDQLSYQSNQQQVQSCPQLTSSK